MNKKKKEDKLLKEDEIVKDKEIKVVDDKDKEVKDSDKQVEDTDKEVVDKDKEIKDTDKVDDEEVVDVEALKQENQDLKDKIAELESGNPDEEKSEKEIALEEREQRLWDKEVSMTLKENGLEDFKDFISVEVGDEDQLNVVVSKLKEIISQIEMKNSYVPTETPSVDEYSIAKKNKDVKSMIGSKLK